MYSVRHGRQVGIKHRYGMAWYSYYAVYFLSLGERIVIMMKRRNEISRGEVRWYVEKGAERWVRRRMAVAGLLQHQSTLDQKLKRYLI